MSGLLYLLDVYEALLGASAVAATTLIRYLLGAGFPLFIDHSEHSPFCTASIHQPADCVANKSLVFAALGVGWAASIFGFISLALLPIPWALYRWGPQLRASSKIAFGSQK